MKYFYCIALLAYFSLKLSLVENQKCVKMQHDSEEFRYSAGDYPVLDSIHPSSCQALCKAENFSYAAVMVDKFCLCSYTNYDYPEIDEQCCNETGVSCGDDPDTIAAMEVDPLANITLKLNVKRKLENTDGGTKVSLEYEIAVSANVMAEVRLFYDGKEIRGPVEVTEEEFEENILFLQSALPGRHVAKAIAYDVAEETVSVTEEAEIFIPDTKVSFDFSCPEFLVTGETGVCNLTILRGTDLQARLRFGNEDEENIVIPDATVVPVGFPVPFLLPSDASDDSRLPEVVHVALGDLPISILIGFDFLARDAGSFDIQILAPKCGDGEIFCGTCRSSCPEKGTSVCGEETESFCSFSKTCVDSRDDPPCLGTHYQGDLIEVGSFSVEAKEAGYNYYPLEESDYVKLQPGYLVALKRGDAAVVESVVVADEEWCDREEGGELLNVHHLLRPVVIVPMNVSFPHNFTKAGKYRVRAEVSSEPDGPVEEKEVTVLVLTYLSGLSLAGPTNCTDVGQAAAVEATLEEGINVTFTWMAEDFEDRSYIVEESPARVVENYTCSKEENFTIVLNASDSLTSEQGAVDVCCVNRVSRNWKLESDSPKIAPPGEITMTLSYTGDATYFPSGAVTDLDFGDSDSQKDIIVDSETLSVSETHTYVRGGVYNVTAHVRNSVDQESFSTEVLLLDKLGELTVTAQYAESENSDNKDMHGPDKTDVPVNAFVSFFCNISGSVENHTMEMAEDTVTQDGSNSIFTKKFEQVGEYSLSFKSSNFLEESNSVTLAVRAMAEPVGLGLTADPSNIVPGEEVVFSLEFESADPFTCISFDADEGEVLETFGNEDTCRLMMKDGMHFNPRGEQRKKRETEEASWIDDNHISIRYVYNEGGVFKPTAKAFNTIFGVNASAVVEAAYPPSNIWIENNSTNIRRPMKYFREETFRLETTAQVYDHPSRSYEMRWHVDKMTASNEVVETVDISGIRSSNCSALRFPHRFLDVGLYRVEYTIHIYDDGSLLESPSCFTYLEIMSGNLRPMIIRGGASYVLRGHGQEVYLEAGKYSEDPDDPEDKEFRMEWSCRCVSAPDFMPDGEAYEEDTSLSEQVVNLHHMEKQSTQEECFKDTKKLQDLHDPQLVFNTNELRDSRILYEIEVTVSKDSRRQQARIYLDVIENIPPGLIVMCEKSVACRVSAEGFVVNPSDWLSVRAECVTECGDGKLRYEWELYAVSDTSQEAVALENWSDHVIMDEDRLGINQTFFRAFREHLSFHIKVKGTDVDVDRPPGVAKLYVRVNLPPTPGSCTLSENSGTATLTLFRMDFEGWSDPEGEPLGDFSIYSLHDGRKFHIHYGVKTSVEFILPPGKSDIFCAVKDEIGAITELFVDTIEAALPDKATLEAWKSNLSVDFFMVEGRMSIMAQAIASEAIVEETERKDNFVPVASEVDAVWREYWELSGIDSSYFTKEAREEIEAMLRDQRSEGTEKEAQKNFEMLQSLEVLPFEVMEDTEVYGLAVSALAETRPINKGSKHLLTEFIEEMADSTLNFEAPHPQDKKISNGLLAGVMNSLSKSISEQMIGGNFLDSELEEAYELFKYNITEPNFFILYVNGSRWEVEEKVHETKVEGAKNASEGEVHDQTELMRNVTDRMKMSIAKDLMVGENPLVVESTSGFQLKVEKRHVDEVSGVTIENEGTSITLPNSCVLLGKPKDCRSTREAKSDTSSIGLVVVKWSNILETEGTEDVSLSADSNTLDFSLTNREGNSTLQLKDTPEPFEVCLGVSQSSEGAVDSKMRHVAPSFGDKDDFLVYHQLTIDKSGAAVKVELAPDEMSSPFVFFYGIGYKPSLLVYDGREFMADLQAEGGSYSMLLGASAEEGEDFLFAVGRMTDSSAEKLDTFRKGKKNLTRDDMTNEYSDGYSIALYTTGCYFFSEETSSWSSEGCKVHSSRSNMVCCHCNHLTMFGSGFLIAPNRIDFSYVFANAGFEDNLIIYLVLILSLCLYVVLAVWCRWKDRKDLTKLGATPLPDNDIQDKYFYEILVQTGYQFNAATKSKVHFIISGEDDETDVRALSDDQRPVLQRGAIDCFIMSVPRCLGQLNYLRIWHDNSGEGKNASWYLKHVVVKDIITGYKYEFIAERWFAVEEGDGLIDHLIPVAGKEQMTEFSHLFPNASRRSLTDNHLWLSVFTRPPRSRFTRLQRLSCCLSILYLSMLTSAMWYETTPEQPSPGAFKFGPLSLSPEQITVGLMSNLIVFPPSFVMIILFRKSRARELRPSHVNVALEKQYEQWRKTYGLSMGRKVSKAPKASEVRRHRPSVDEEAHSGARLPRKKCLLPWWCALVSWFLVIVSVCSSVFFLWAYGLQFGNIRTGKWLTSLVISFFSSVLLTEPLKIFLIAIIMACLCGNPDVDDDDSDDDEEDPYLQKDEEWLHSVSRDSVVQRPKYRPIDPQSLEAARKLREQEVRMYGVMKEMGAYVLYLWILFVLSYGNRDPNSFYLREATINNFIKPGDLWVDFHNVNTEVKFWNWTRNALIPELFAGLWYNNRPPLGLRLLVDDRNNFKIGYPVLRQVRARTDSCTVPEVMTDIISECAGYGNLVNENGAIYSKFWSTNLTMASRIPPEYKYMTASDLNGFPFWGQLDWYGGGGYVVPLVAKRYEDGAKLIKRMEELEQTGWINKDTRAVFVEFGTYNAQVNLFVVATIVAEFLPGGGIIPYYHIDPIRLLHYHTGSGLLQLLCQIGFVLFTLYYTVLELRALCKEGREHFSQYWNVAELWNVLASWAVIGVEIYKMIITQRVLAIFTATEGTGYIKLQEALILDEAFCYLIGFLMSLATLKFLKLLRFNKRIGGMIATVRLCAQELKGYGVCLIVTFLAFVTLFWMTLGRAVREFCSFVSSFESSISMLLKKFNYYDIEQADSIIGPLAFFTFALTASVVLINILLTIIIQSFEEVKHDLQFQNSDYELMDFIMKRLRLFFGRGNDKRSRIVPITFATASNKKNDVMDSFNGKVDRLLDFINSVYLDEQVDLEFLSKARSQIPTLTANQEQLERKKSRPRKIPRYQPLHVKKHLDF